MIAFLSWYLLLTLLGWLTFPLAFYLFSAMADRGYTFARPFGLLLWGYVFWLFASLRLAQNDVGGLLPREKEATIQDLLGARSGVYHIASYPGDFLAEAPPRGSPLDPKRPRRQGVRRSEASAWRACPCGHCADRRTSASARRKPASIAPRWSKCWRAKSLGSTRSRTARSTS